MNVVRQQSRKIHSDQRLRELLDAMAEAVVILNPQRQVVFCNRRLLEIVGVQDRESVYGLRPGEILMCSNACKDPGGCGTAEFCSTCGGVNAILLSQRGIPEVKECSIERDEGGEAIDLLVKASPLEVGGEKFTICALTDISHEKRRRALERIFFHDLMNTASALKLLASTALAGGQAGRLRTVIDRMVGEIEAQKDLAAAEHGELALRPDRVSAAGILEEVRAAHEGYAGLVGCSLAVAEDSGDAFFSTDPALLSRVLGNMVKNAIEAAGRGAVVSLRSSPSDGGVLFGVHNPGFIPRPVQMQLFQRSFSTKGPDRGLGAYGMKLLSERYLGGRVWFATDEERGTTFHAWYPKELPALQTSP